MNIVFTAHRNYSTEFLIKVDLLFFYGSTCPPVFGGCGLLLSKELETHRTQRIKFLCFGVFVAKNMNTE